MINASFSVYNLQLQTGIHGPKPVDPGPSGLVLVLGPGRTSSSFRNLGPNRTGTGPDQYREKFQNLGQDRTKTNEILKMLNWFGPVCNRTLWSVDPWHWTLSKVAWKYYVINLPIVAKPAASIFINFISLSKMFKIKFFLYFKSWCKYLMLVRSRFGADGGDGWGELEAEIAVWVVS